MADLLAIVSKAEFEDKHRGAKLGDVLSIDRYVSKNPRLESLASGGSLFLVTVRPPDEALWLVGILEHPKHDGTSWVAAKNATAVRDIGSIQSALVFESGKGLVAKPGALGMALQTPRGLTAADVALLRGGAPPALAKAAKTGPAKSAPAKSASAKAAKAPKKAPPAPAKQAEVALEPTVFKLVEFEGERARAAEELLRRITVDPEDLDARRILADLHLEVGDSRGTFIQLALRLDEMDETDPERPALERAVTSLERRGALAWSRDIRRVGDLNQSGKEWGHTKFAFRRGFVETLTGAGKEVLGDLDAAAEVAPIRRLDLRECRESDLKKLAGSPALEKARELSIRLGEDGPRGLRELFESPRLAALRSLEIHGVLTPALVEQLAATPALASLEHLHLKTVVKDGIGAAGLRTLIDSGTLQGLRRLHLEGQTLGAEGVALLGALGKLTSLTIDNDAPRLTGVQALVSSSFAPTLKSLSLTRCELSDKGAIALVQKDAFPSLVHLGLEGSAPGGKKLASWLDAFALPRVESLSLSGSTLRVEGAKALAATRALERIVRLRIAGNAFKHEGASILSRAQHYPRLTELDIGANIIDAVGFRALAEGPFMQNVLELDAANNKCGTEGGKELAKWPGLAKLEALTLSYNWMGVLGVRALLERASSLRKLVAGENNYGAEPIRAIASGACPRLVHLYSYEAEARQVAALANSPAASTLETISLGSTAFDTEVAESLAALPNLGLLRLVFCPPLGGAAAVLRKRLGPFLELWGNIDAWNRHPGPA